MAKEKLIIIELGFSVDNREAIVRLTCDEPMTDEDIYLSLEDYLLNNAYISAEPPQGGMLH